MAWSTSLRWIAPIVAVKVLILVLVYWSVVLVPMPFNLTNYQGNFYYPRGAPITLATAYKTWDAQHYLYISQAGYDDPRQRAFFPLWPAVIRLVTPPGDDPLVPSLIAANLLSIAALVLLHRLMAIDDGLAAADTGMVLVLAFPAAFCLCLPYSESLFLLLIVAMFLAMRADRPVWIWIFSALLPLARAMGFFCIFAIVLDQWIKRRPKRAVALATGPLAGLAGYFALFYFLAGDPLASFHVQSLYTADASMMKLLHPVDFLKLFFTPSLEIHGFFNSAIDRAVFVLFLASLWPIARRRLVDAAYCIPVGIIPAVATSMMSWTRYALVLFPMFACGGIYLSRPKAKWWVWIVAALNFALQVIFLIRHTHIFWAI